MDDTHHRKQHDQPTLYRHTLRPEWGHAIVAWERNGKRGYQFEDGELRVISEGYYGLFRATTPPPDRAADMLADIDRQLARRQRTRASQRKQQTPPVPFELQVALFERDYPEGFRGARWRERVRGEGASRRLKRHRNPAIAHAQQVMATTALEPLIAAADWPGVCARIVEVLQSTDLVPVAQTRPLEDLAPARAVELATAMRDMLHGADTLAGRFDRLVGAFTACLRKSPSWRLATAVPALYAPDRYLCVRSTVAREQCKWMAPRLDVPARPDGQTYADLVTVAHRVVDELRASGRRPADLLDVYDFSWHTLRPAARKQIDELRARQAASGASPTPAQA